MVRSSWIAALGVVLASIAPGWGQVLQQERLVLIREAGKPPVQCRVLKVTRQKDGSRVCQVQPVGGGEVMTIVEDGGPAMPTAVASAPTPVPATSPAPRLLPTPGATPLPGVPVSTSERVVRPQPTSTTTVVQTDADKPTLIGRLFGRGSERSKVTMTEVPAPIVKADVEAPPFGTDLRRSWGKVDRTPTPVVKEASKPALSSRFSLPSARRDSQDPLRQPEALTGGVVPAEELTPRTERTERIERTEVPATTSRSRLRNLVTSRWEPRKSTVDAPTSVVETEVDTGKGMLVETKVKGARLPADAKVVMAEEKPARPARHVIVTNGDGERAGLFDLMRGNGSPTVVERRPLESAKSRLARKGKAGEESMPGVGPQPLIGGRGPGVDVAGGPKPEPKPRGWFWSRKTKSPTDDLGSGQYPSLLAAGPNAFSVEMPQPQGGGVIPTGYNGYGAAMGQPMMPPQAMAMAMAGYGYAPMGYMAPQPGYGPAMGYPAPGGYPTMVAGYYPPVPPMPVPPVAAVASGEPGRASIGDQGGATAGLIGQLRGSLLPSEREMAADRLTRVDWRAEPQVVGALLTAAKGDPAPAVRAACVRSLGKMNVNLVPVVNVVRTLKADTDVRVRQEVEQTLATLGGE